MFLNTALKIMLFSPLRRQTLHRLTERWLGVET